MLRLLGILLMLLGFVALWADLAAPGDGIKLASLAERWAQIHLDSLIGLQSGLENRVDPDAFLDYVLPVLELPAAPVLAALGLALLAVTGALRRI